MTPLDAANRLVHELAEKYWMAVEHGGCPKDLRDAETAWDAVDLMMHIDGIGPWLVVALADEAITDARLAYLAAGPMEDLLETADENALAVVEAALDSSPRLVDSLYRMNDPSSEKSLSWLERCKARHPLPGR